jgi:hypothetical protein
LEKPCLVAGLFLYLWLEGAGGLGGARSLGILRFAQNDERWGIVGVLVALSRD